MIQGEKVLQTQNKEQLAELLLVVNDYFEKAGITGIIENGHMLPMFDNILSFTLENKKRNRGMEEKVEQKVSVLVSDNMVRIIAEKYNSINRYVRHSDYYQPISAKRKIVEFRQCEEDTNSITMDTMIVKQKISTDNYHGDMKFEGFENFISIAVTSNWKENPLNDKYEISDNVKTVYHIDKDVKLTEGIFEATEYGTVITKGKAKIKAPTSECFNVPA